MMDLDKFKTINDTHGHLVGDAVLVAVARTLEGTVRASDTVARLGGDEFCIIAPEISSVETAQILREKIRTSIAQIEIEPRIKIAASIGFAVFPIDASTADTLYMVADRAMYQQKHIYSGSTALG